MSARFRTPAGRTVTLGPRLGSGGEGVVHGVAGASDEIAKLYHEEVDARKLSKLQVMVADRSKDALRAIAAWPQELLLDEHRKPRGFLMPRVHDASEIHELFGTQRRMALFPDGRWDLLVHVARNVAAAVQTVHSAGHVIGDLNQSGVLVARDATVRLIDCDSFQITQGQTVYFSLVGVPDFTAPELIGADFSRTVRSVEHDRFALAVLVFKLLFFGRHPFVGRMLDGSPVDMIDSIKRGLFAYGSRAKARGIARPQNAFKLLIVPEAVQQLFERAFSPDAATRGRPSAQDWVTALEALRRGLKHCQQEPAHRFASSLNDCPWCPAETQWTTLLFTPARKAHVTQVLDLVAVRRRLAALDLPDPLPSAPCPLPQGLVGAGLPQHMWVQRWLHRTLLTVGGGLTLCAALGWLPRALLFAGTAVVLVGVVLRMLPELNALRRQRQAVVDEAEAAWLSACEAWQAPLADLAQRFDAKRSAAARAVRDYEQQLERYKRELAGLTQQVQELQRADFLRRFQVDIVSLPWLSTSLVAALRSEGIETAADITADVDQVPGIGPKRKEQLLLWRSSCAAGFVFSAAKGVPAMARDEVNHRHQLALQNIERKLTVALQEAEGFQRSVQQRLPFTAEHEVLARAYAQARADLDALG